MRVEFVPEFIAAGEVLEDRQICNGGGLKGSSFMGMGILFRSKIYLRRGRNS